MIICFAGCDKTDPSYQNSSASEPSTTDNTENTAINQEDDDVLLSVLYNKTPFITAKGTTVYMKDYKPFYKYPDDIDYYEKDNVFVPGDYAYVDLDKDGRNELVVSESPYADTYLILYKTSDKIYGCSLYGRWFQSLKSDGTFLSSGGAYSNSYNTISFNENIYNISTIAKFDFIADTEKPSSDKYGFEPDYEKSVFEIKGKKVSFDEIEKFVEEWDKRPEAEWIKFE